GIDPSKELIPVAPALHYAMGGIRTDLDGRTTREKLWAVGEVARTGVHGANRLASNSLLEGLVFADRVARAVAETPSRSAAGGAWVRGPPRRAPTGLRGGWFCGAGGGGAGGGPRSRSSAGAVQGEGETDT